MSSRSGDGWTWCSAGHRHWGIHGAAGLLLVRDDEVLLQLRAAHIHQGGSWSVPGGARDFHESAVDAALREAHEEIGVGPREVTTVGSSVDDHGGWRYTTVIAIPAGTFSPIHNHESAGVAWVPIGEVGVLPLHPGFRASWDLVGGVVRGLLPLS